MKNDKTKNVSSGVVVFFVVCFCIFIFPPNISKAVKTTKAEEMRDMEGVDIEAVQTTLQIIYNVGKTKFTNYTKNIPKINIYARKAKRKHFCSAL